MSDWLSDSSFPEEAEFDTLDGMGEEDGMLAGKESGTCEIVEKDFAGAKSTLVKMLGLKG